jgi:hypothetical protein
MGMALLIVILVGMVGLLMVWIVVIDRRLAESLYAVACWRKRTLRAESEVVRLAQAIEAFQSRSADLVSASELVCEPV